MEKVGLHNGIKQVYSKMKKSSFLPLFLKIDGVLKKILGKYYAKIVGQVKKEANYSPCYWDGTNYEDAEVPMEDCIWNSDEKYEEIPDFLVSVITTEPIPESLKKQTYKKYEVVLLKNEQENIENWKEACRRAKGELIWLIEKGTQYEKTYLERLVKAFAYDSTAFAFGRIEEKKKSSSRPSFRMASYLFVQRECKEGKWMLNIQNGVFRNSDTIFSEPYLGEQMQNKEVAALSVMRGGCVCYVDEAVGYCTKTKEKKVTTNEETQTYIAHYYDANTKKMPNVLMACYSFQPGGGETYPIYLANEMQRQHITVTLLDMGLGKTEATIKKRVKAGLPIVKCKSADEIPKIILQMGADVIHTHQATVDGMVARWLGYNSFHCRHYVTLHGMYEALHIQKAREVIEVLDRSCEQYVYIADKNLTPFRQLGYYQEERFTKMANGLPQKKAQSLSRKELGIEEMAFVFCLASRGIPEKGWQEAMEAVTKAREISGKKIELLLVGGGEEKKRLEKKAPSYIHFTGVKENVRDYYMTADAGILPTTFQGESYPLVVIECLQCQKPVIATDIAEVCRQLQDEEGNLAGELLTLHEGKLNVDEIAEKICHMVQDKAYYQMLKGRCYSAAKKFDIAEIVRQYLNLYVKKEGKKNGK